MEQENYNECLYYSVNALARSMTRMAEESFAITGMSPSYAFILMSINRDPGIQVGEIAEVMQLTPSTVTRLVEKLELKGFVKRKTEGKFTFVHPTKKAIQMEKTIRQAWGQLTKQYNEIIGKTETERLNRLVNKSYEKLESE